MNRELDLTRRIDSILSNTGGGQLQDYRAVDYSAKIPNREDREFTRSVVDAVFALEPNNGRLNVNVDTPDPSTILVFAEGLSQHVDLNYYAKIMRLPHPVPDFKGVSKVYMAPARPGNPARFVVELNSCVGRESGAGLEQLFIEEDRGHRRRSSSRARPAVTSRSPSPPPRRSPRRRDRSPPRRQPAKKYSSSSSSSSSDSEPGILSKVVSIFTG